MASEHKGEVEDPMQTIKDLTSGAVGGIAQVLLGQPFDIVKVRLQTTTHYSNALDCATKIFAKEGPLAFYKGTLTPLIGIGACVSVQFGAFHEARRYFERMNAQKGSKDPHLSYSQYYLSGAFAGIVNSVISGPIEHVRIRLQTQPHGEGRLYSGPLDCIKKLSSQGGLFNGLYRGEVVTILREAQAYGTWFLSFEYMMDWEARRTNTKREDIPAYKIAGYGGLAGEMLWLSSYPFDVVKSKMQSDGFGEQQRYKNMRDCFRQTLAQEGMRGFVKGIAPTLLRAAPVSAGTFAAFELTKRALG
ncbi:carrier protein [Trichophyton mentagrophytes]|nr:carrier protein [Trichophyton mentagrophytes]